MESYFYSSFLTNTFWGLNRWLRSSLSRERRKNKTLDLSLDSRIKWCCFCACDPNGQSDRSRYYCVAYIYDRVCVRADAKLPGPPPATTPYVFSAYDRETDACEPGSFTVYHSLSHCLPVSKFSFNAFYVHPRHAREMQNQFDAAAKMKNHSLFLAFLSCFSFFFLFCHTPKLSSLQLGCLVWNKDWGSGGWDKVQWGWLHWLFFNTDNIFFSENAGEKYVSCGRKHNVRGGKK